MGFAFGTTKTLLGRNLSILKLELSSYKAYSLMEFDGKRVLIIPACKNRKIRRNARPLADIYLIIKV